MALHSIDNQGNLTWQCTHIPGEADEPCNTHYTHHISHEAIQWHGTPGSPKHHHMVSLPPCPACGGQTFLKVHFTEKELLAKNMWIPWSGELEERLQLLQRLQIMSTLPEEFAKAGYTRQVVIDEIAQLAAIKAAGGMPTNSRAIAERHMQLPGHMEKHGKAVPSQ